MLLQVAKMPKTLINQYFNPDQHLVFHQDKEGNMIGGGYQINNLLYQHKVPLFVSLDNTHFGGGKNDTIEQSGGGRDESVNKHFIPEKFSDLFRDLAVPAGLFMMPPLYRPRNYAFEVPDLETQHAEIVEDKKREYDDDDESGSSSESESECESGEKYNKTKQVPKDIFDTLLSLVAPSERIHHDVKTRRQRGILKNKKRTTTIKRSRT